jgi:hypothetical protein
MSNQIFHFSNTGVSSGQRFYLKDDVSGIFVRNLNIDSNFPVVASNLVYNTGDQTISGVKTFASRPTVNGTGVLLSGEAANVTLPATIVYTTGNQTISGIKNFISRPTVNGTGVLLSGEASSVILPNTIVYTTGDQIISGKKTFAQDTFFGDSTQDNLFVVSGNRINFGVRPTVNGTGFLLSGDPIVVTVVATGDNIVYTTGNQIIFGIKTFDVAPVVSGNRLITGINTNSFASTSNLFATGSTLDNKINSLSGYVNSQNIIFSGQTFNTGSRLDNKINALSGYVNFQDIIFSGQTFNTGSRLDNKINSLSGYVNSQDIIFSGQTFNTGSRLDNKINSLSGYVSGISQGGLLSSTIVYITGNQIISGNKTFVNSGVFSLSGITPLSLPNNPLSIVGSGNTYIQINIQNRATGTNATADLVITANNGNDSSNYLDLGINNSGYNDPNFSNGSAYDGYLFINGGNLDIGTQTPNTAVEFHIGGTTAARTIARITSDGLNIVSGGLTASNVVYNTGNQIISGVKTFASRPTVNGTGVLLSGEGIASLITIQDEGSSQGSASTLNFIGGGVSVSVGGSTAAITINGGGGTSLVSPPPTPNSAGTSGQMALDQNYSYFCISDNNWRRSAIGSW